ncbi:MULTISPECIES: GIY-YIG nuclease family protein [unclassified Thioalkalivibrio]|uniref:GIY-YIG nuclease family protein n=1 Tax=unclassified Thioalkalivibrio TaxID=2621013 RepID=UPI00037C572D|nr:MULTISPECIES: GIY-YIG nuclease family protein [unclassified Thioalkalivibrio]
MPRYRSLDEVLSEPDDQGLLDVRAAGTQLSPSDRIRDAFEAINAFVDTHGRAPTNEGDLSEKTLHRRLQRIRASKGAHENLLSLDRHHLLGSDGGEGAPSRDAASHAESLESDVENLDDILLDDDLGLLDLGDESILASRCPAGDRPSGNTPPDGIAQRRPCEEFWRFEPLFERMRNRLESGDAESRRFQYETKIDVGDYFIVYGLLCLVDSVADPRMEIDPANPRLRVVFDNGTETNLLKFSLGKALYADENGRRIIDPDLEADRMAGVSHHDHRSGTIYILRSRSPHPSLKEHRDLVKIGYTEGEVADRIRNAENDPAFLEGPVEVVESFACYNLDPRKFEGLVHGFLADRRLDIQLRSKKGRVFRPREWFSVSPQTAVQVVEAIVDGSITRYRLDPISGRFLAREK